VVGTIASYFGYTVDQNAAGVRRASTYSVVFCCMLVIASHLILNAVIPFWLGRNFR
jgi:ABC-type transporter Mla maintaining outer membrane lipid asymmetry permease subunit MlaE